MFDKTKITIIFEQLNIKFNLRILFGLYIGTDPALKAFKRHIVILILSFLAFRKELVNFALVIFSKNS